MIEQGFRLFAEKGIEPVGMLEVAEACHLGIATIYRSPLFLLYAWFGCLAMIGGFAKYFDHETPFTKWMSSHSWGLYVFHYLGISAVALFIAKSGFAPAWAYYLLSLVCGFALAYGLYFVISRMPFFRWAVLGISKQAHLSE